MHQLSPELCYNVVYRDLGCHIIQDITLVHYTDDIMLIVPTDQEVVTVEVIGTLVGKEFLDTDHFRRE